MSLVQIETIMPATEEINDFNCLPFCIYRKLVATLGLTMKGTSHLFLRTLIRNFVQIHILFC